jgi:hypothetical protein
MLIKALKSKTVQFNLLIALVGLMEQNLGLFKGLFSNPNHFSWFCFGIAITGIVLRVVTTKALSEK